MNKKLKALQALCRTQIDSLNSAIPHLEPALAKQFTDLRAQFQEALDGFPAAAGDNDADAKAEVEGLYSCLTKSHELFNGLVASLSDLKTQLAAKLTALAGLEAKVSSGELVPKATVTELCSASAAEARKTAETETTLKLQTEYQVKADQAKLITDRKAILLTASLPMAPDEILGLPEADFVKARTEAVNRCAPFKGKLKTDGATLPRLAWCSAAEYDGLLKLVKETTGGVKISYDPLMGNGNTSGSGSSVNLEFVPV